MRYLCGNMPRHSNRGLALKAGKEFIKGNEAICRGAINCGCRYYYGYPITPQNDIPEYMSAHLHDIGGVYLQAESEIATINFIIGTAATGKRVMTSSSGPGISLMQEGISYMAGMELPAVIVNISRSGPGLGGINTSQGDYFQATRGGGHGDYRTLVFAPHTVQEMYDLTMRAFDVAERYRNPVMILGDAIIGQMKEPFLERSYEPSGKFDRSWVIEGCAGRDTRQVTSLYLKGNSIEVHNLKLAEKYRIMKKETSFEDYMAGDAKILLIAFGTSARVCKTAIQWARNDGIRAGLLRPVTLFPFPESCVKDMVNSAEKVVVVEMNTGQMIDDVRSSTTEHEKLESYCRPCQMLTPEEIFRVIKEKELVRLGNAKGKAREKSI